MLGSSAARAASCVVVGAVLALAAPAAANEFCVMPATGCAGGQQPTLQAALDAASAAGGADTVRLPAGVVDGPGYYETANGFNTVEIVGAGRDATVITATTGHTNNGYILEVRNFGAARDLTVREPSPQPAGQTGGTFFVGTLDRVGFDGVDAGGSIDIAGLAHHVRGTGPVTLRLSGGAGLEDAELLGGTLNTGTSIAVAHRVRVVSPLPLVAQNSQLLISSSLFVATDPDAAVLSLRPQPVVDGQGSVILSNVTVVGGGGAGCVGISASGDNFRMPPDDDTLEHVSVANTIVRNCATTIRRASGGGNKRADLDVHNSDLDLSAAAVSDSGNGTLLAGPAADDFNSDPLFVGLPGAEQLLRFDSPAIDRGLPDVVSADESATDLAGNPRVVKGRPDGAERRDVGAYEYQRRAPTATASAGATSAEIGQRVVFTGAATDPDPGDAVALAWRFDDGAITTGPTVSHAFAKAGRHTAILTATDSSGLPATATAAVTILVAPAVRTLSLSPKTFRAATKGASVAASRRPRVGTRVRLALTRAAAVKLTVQKRAPGRRVGGRCVKATRRNRARKACVRYVTLRGSVTRKAGAPSTFRFRGRWRGRALRPGRYRLVAGVARTPAKTAAFRIVG